MELSIALKSLLATLTTKTSLASTDGFMTITTSDGTPNGKIGLDALKEVLYLPIRVLISSDNIDNLGVGMYAQRDARVIGGTKPPIFANGVLVCLRQFSGNDRYLQIYFEINTSAIYYRTNLGDGYRAWKNFSFDVPTFYNSYADLAALTSAVYKGQWYGDCTTAADTAAKTCTISGFLAVPTSVVTVHFASAINVAASTLNGTTATLNISSTGAKPIMYKGVPVQPGVVRAGNLVTMQYDGTNYNIIGIEGLESSAVPSNLYVDMGLPSGTLWATRNIDITQANGFAASEYQYECSFFSWGNTEGHNPSSTSAFAYDWGSANDGVYASTPGSKIMGQLSPSQDFARANCGAPWRLPTTADFAELFANIEYIDAQGSVIASSTTDKRTTMNGITGLRIRSTVNGNIIFFPCSGYGYGASWLNRGAYGLYWSSSLSSATGGRYLRFNSGGVYPQSNDGRFYGFAARPVQ